MVKVYAVTLALGILGLLVAVLGGSLARNTGSDNLYPGTRIGPNLRSARGKALLGAVIGFGMGGMSAELAPIDLPWQVCLLIAVVAAGLSIFWVRYAVGQSEA